MSTVALIDYGSGNLRSAAKALERAAADAGLSTDILVTADADAVHRADRIVLPGVGAYGDCKRGLSEVPGMLDALEEAVIRGGRPFLGICVGMQLMAERGVEHGVHQGLGWIKGEVVALDPADPTLKIPHMGWNELDIVRPHPVLAGLPAGAHAYFVHSYHIRCADPANELARVEYGGPVTAVIGRDNMVGTQFHPEKSQDAGLTLIANFLQWRP
ncbi:imidazole glycerol phosphate synthase subunit HisH [Azospirillum sp. TSO22-1]|uniref:imidazole glycerol phosphate synthase subunit HisH n=1 Tax=Azospirillum sp. TSO22-1 TaxID=716789 RepID=UPI000D621AD2|nr:imidazole glycerol phosphate synthase subunit HisH [Azospirillum sp. TSO22-1]PWC41357.1 imidazole glycerol phosphate synthase [Azospirillum sp. TSO22-1]